MTIDLTRGERDQLRSAIATTAEYYLARARAVMPKNGGLDVPDEPADQSEVPDLAGASGWIATAGALQGLAKAMMQTSDTPSGPLGLYDDGREQLPEPDNMLDDYVGTIDHLTAMGDALMGALFNGYRSAVEEPDRDVMRLMTRINRVRVLPR